MSEQVTHALKQAGIMIVLAALAALGAEYTGILDAAQVNPVYYPIVGAVIAGAVRWFEGGRDSVRNNRGEMVKADVGFAEVAKIAKNTPAYEYPIVSPMGTKIYL